MTIKKFELEGWETGYLEGEATADDVIVTKLETGEHVPEELERGNYYANKTTSVIIKLKDDILRILRPDGKDDSRHAGRRTTFQTTLQAFTPCHTKSERAIKRMHTQHEKDCEANLSQHKIDEEVQRIVKNANWEIRESQKKFVSVLSRSMESVESWDNKDRLDELATVRKALKEKISDIEKEMKSLMKGEIDEWLTEANCDREIKDEILKKARFSYIPEILVIQ